MHRSGWLISAIASAALFGWLARRSLLVIRIDGDSMTPTFGQDDAVLVLKPRLDRSVRRDDVVVFRLPVGTTGPAGNLVKRVVAISGDPVPGSGDAGDGGQLAPGQVYLVGDGPSSWDSRRFGPLSVADLQGRVIARLAASTRRGAPLRSGSEMPS
ncbi:MAG: S26 family signal peptidase [Jatrophihabitans sp.]